MKHLAILKPPFLELILEGKKTIESRATKVRCAPYKKVSENDVIYFRESGNFAVIAKARVKKVRYYDEDILKVLFQFRDELCITDHFITVKSEAKYLTLIWLDDIERIVPFQFPKKDRRAWVVDLFVEESLEKFLKEV